MLDRVHGEVVFECDTCGDVLETGEDDFNEAREVLKAERWRTYKEGEVWLHACPKCKGSV